MKSFAFNGGVVQINDGVVRIKDGVVRIKDGVVRIKDGVVQIMASRLFISTTVAAIGLIAPNPRIANAANIPFTVRPGQMSMPFHHGSVSGGQAGPDFSLLGVKEVSIPRGGMQIVLNYGDHLGHPLHGEPGYFHVSIDRVGKRISMDLAQVLRTAIDQKDLSRELSRSSIVSSSDITTDPADGSTNITLNLRRPVEMKVRSSGGDQAKLILELKPFESAAGPLKSVVQ